MGQNAAGVPNQPQVHGESPTGVPVVDVDLNDFLAFGVENVGALPDGVLRRELGPNHEHCVGVAHHSVGRILAVDSHHAQRQRVGFGDGALSFIAGGHWHTPHLCQFPELVVGFGHVDPVARDQNGPAGLRQYLHRSLNVLGSTLGLGRVHVPCGVVDEGRSFHVHLASDGCAAHDHASRSGPAAGGVFQGQLDANHSFLGSGSQAGVLGHRLEYRGQVYAAVLACSRLVGGVKSHPPVGGVGNHQHGRAAEHGLHDAEGGVGADEQSLAHDRRRPPGGPAVGVGHDCRYLLVAHQNGLYAVFLSVEQAENLAGTAAGYTEHILHSRFFQSLHDQLA